VFCTAYNFANAPQDGCTGVGSSAAKVTAEKEWVLVTKRKEIKFRPTQIVFYVLYAGWPKKKPKRNEFNFYQNTLLEYL
jgi:hypothetical protein